MLREAVKNETPVGMKAKGFMNEVRTHTTGINIKSYHQDAWSPSVHLVVIHIFRSACVGNEACSRYIYMAVLYVVRVPGIMLRLGVIKLPRFKIAPLLFRSPFSLTTPHHIIHARTSSYIAYGVRTGYWYFFVCGHIAYLSYSRINNQDGHWVYGCTDVFISTTWYSYVVYTYSIVEKTHSPLHVFAQK